MRGRFITFEGGEGTGKSTQAALLAKRLRNFAIAVVQTREPGGSLGAEIIRHVLLSGAAKPFGPDAEALLFAAARADHVAKTIRPALAAGQWVLCDRFLDSSRAYQGGAGGLADADILALHRVGSGGLLPDRTLLLALAPQEAAARSAARDVAGTDRIGGRDAAYHAGVAAAFAGFAATDPARFRMVDASGSPEAVTAKLLAALADLLP